MSEIGEKIEAGFTRIYDKIEGNHKEVIGEVSDIKERMASVETQVKFINGKSKS